MKKTISIILLACLFGCKKENQCIRCENSSHEDPTERVFEGCRGVDLHDQTDMKELYDIMTDYGYTCNIYQDG